MLSFSGNMGQGEGLLVLYLPLLGSEIWRDLAFSISFHGEIITEGPPPKCFPAYGVVFFSSWSHRNDPLLIVKNRSCVDGGRVPRNAFWERYKMADESSLNNVSVRIQVESEPKNCSAS